MSYNDDMNGEDVGEYYAAQHDFEKEQEVESDYNNSSRLTKKEKDELGELATKIMALRSQKNEIEKQLKDLTEEVANILEKHHKTKWFCQPEGLHITLSYREYTSIDRNYLKKHYPSAFSKAIKYNGKTKAIYVRNI